jgi:hypothetical protein
MREHGYLVAHWPIMATASSSLAIAVMEGDGRIKEGAPSLLSPAWTGRTSRTPLASADVVYGRAEQA